NPDQEFFTSSFVSAGRRTGSGILGTTNVNPSVTASPTSKVTLQGDLTFYKTGWVGSHEFQTGLFAQPRLSNRDDRRYPNGGAALEELSLLDPNNLNSGSVLFHRRVYDSPPVTSAVRLARDYPWFAPDAWK